MSVFRSDVQEGMVVSCLHIPLHFYILSKNQGEGFFLSKCTNHNLQETLLLLLLL